MTNELTKIFIYGFAAGSCVTMIAGSYVLDVFLKKIRKELESLKKMLAEKGIIHNSTQTDNNWGGDESS